MTTVKEEQWYACPGATPLGDARCRNQEGQCPEHGEVYTQAPRPDIVMLRFTINPNQSKRLEQAGIRRIVLDREALDKEHVATAKRVGRDPYLYDTDRRHVADAGVRVFGEKDPEKLCVLPAWEEMEKSGYQLVDVQLTERRAGGMDILTLVVSNMLDMPLIELSDLAWERVNMCLGCRWRYTTVWANPRGRDTLIRELAVDDWTNRFGEDGYIVHTVNTRHRSDERPSHTLGFAGGLWELD